LQQNKHLTHLQLLWAAAVEHLRAELHLQLDLVLQYSNVGRKEANTL